MYVRLFFCQAEDGIRDIGVTGVQTCALPISRPPRRPGAGRRAAARHPHRLRDRAGVRLPAVAADLAGAPPRGAARRPPPPPPVRGGGLHPQPHPPAPPAAAPLSGPPPAAPPPAEPARR